MPRKYILLILIPFLIESLIARNIVDCRTATSTVKQCNPYSFKFIRAKKVKYEDNRQKLIVKKTLPTPPRPKEKDFSVLDIVDKYVDIEEPVRYRGEEESIDQDSVKKKEQDNSLAEETKARRVALIEKMQKLYKEQELKRIEGLELAEKMEKDRLEKLKQKEQKVSKKVGFYTIVSGDSLSGIAEMFKMKTSKLIEINDLKKNVPIRIGKKLIIPYDQEIIDIISKAEYIVKKGDNFSSIAKEFNLTSSDIVKYNKLKKDSKIRVGQTLYLPFPYKLAQEKRKKKLLAKKEALKKKKAKKKKSKMVKGFGNRRLRVTATAYSSHHSQTDKTPFLAAWNNRIRPGMKIIAVSRDMLTRYGLRNGSKVKIGGLSGYYTVRDKMNKRYKKRIDIYMGVNRRRALRWGRRSVMLYY
jgi:LysM repeat protein